MRRQPRTRWSRRSAGGLLLTACKSCCHADAIATCSETFFFEGGGLSSFVVGPFIFKKLALGDFGDPWVAQYWGGLQNDLPKLGISLGWVQERSGGRVWY